MIKELLRARVISQAAYVREVRRQAEILLRRGRSLFDRDKEKQIDQWLQDNPGHLRCPKCRKEGRGDNQPNIVKVNQGGSTSFVCRQEGCGTPVAAGRKLDLK